jgi:hypothetical protein
MSKPEYLPTRAALDRRLLPGRVLRLACTRPGRLIAREGQLWITHDAVAPSRTWTSEDLFLARGQSLEVAPGDVIVVSACNPRYGLAAYDWMPVAAPSARPAVAPRPRASGFLQGLARLAGGEAALLA